MPFTNSTNVVRRTGECEIMVPHGPETLCSRGTPLTEWRYQMSRWQIVPEGVWVGAGTRLVTRFSSGEAWTRVDKLVLLAGIVFAICGTLMLFGKIQPPDSNEAT